MFESTWPSGHKTSIHTLTSSMASRRKVSLDGAVDAYQEMGAWYAISRSLSKSSNRAPSGESPALEIAIAHPELYQGSSQAGCGSSPKRARKSDFGRLVMSFSLVSFKTYKGMFLSLWGESPSLPDTISVTKLLVQSIPFEDLPRICRSNPSTFLLDPT